VRPAYASATPEEEDMKNDPSPAARRRASRLILLAAAALLLAGCFPVLPSRGGGQTQFAGPREVNAADVALPEGYRIEAVTTGLTFPTGVSFDAEGAVHVLEAGYSYGEVITTPRLLRLSADGAAQTVTEGSNGPWNGLTFHDGAFFIAGGTIEGGELLRVTPEGDTTVLLSGLPSYGDHHSNSPAIGPDGMVYFGQGTATNSGVVGPDNADFGWLSRYPAFHDIPCQDITLRGVNYETENPLTADPSDRVVTGAFLPFGTPSEPGQVIRGEVPCNGAVLRVSPEGGEPELVAWGFRNPFGLAFSPDGELFVTDNLADVRGSRPVFGTGDLLWRVREGGWYGWPDHHAGRPLDDAEHFTPPGQRTPDLLLAKAPGEPELPVAILGVHSVNNGFDFPPSPEFGFEGQAFIAQFGDMAPGVGKVLAPVGFKVVRVDVTTGVVEDFAINRDPRGPASLVGGGGLERPVAARFSPDGTALYIVDFGVMVITPQGPVPVPGTGVLWRVTRTQGAS
jgi:glucose/arabinose dehydrogenase